VVLILVEGANALAIYYQAVELFSVGILQFDGLAPDPKSLSAGIDGRTDTESMFIFLIEKDAVEEK